MTSLRPRGRRLGGPPPRIGFVVDWLADPYQCAILQGALDAANERGASLVVLPGGVLGAEHDHGARRNQLYKLISPQHMEGLVVMTGTLGNAMATDVLEAIAPDFPRERVASIAVDLPGTSSVLIDNASGMREAVEHLITAHGCQKIGFLRGPTTNPEAESRFQAYKDVLEAHSLPFEERRVAQGDFRHEAGVRAVEVLFDERGLTANDLDALVAADDSMALAVLEELRKRKVRVPSQIKVIGFDDVEEARYANPPLASVRQPLHTQGREAVRAVLALIAGGQPTQSIVLETTASWRRSCGCIPEDHAALSERPEAEIRLDLEAALIKRRELILADITRAARGAFSKMGRGWELKIFNALQDEFKGQTDSFRNAFDQLLEQALDDNSDVSAGNAIISALRRQLTHCAGTDPQHSQRIETLLHEARVLTSDVVERSQALRRLEVQRSARRLTTAGARLTTAFDFDRLSAEMRSQLGELGIESCFLSLLNADDPDTAQMVSAYGEFGAAELRGHRVPFPAAQIVPETYLPVDDTRSLVLQPLLRGQEYLGFATFTVSAVEPYTYEVLREVLSGAIQGALQLPAFDDFDDEELTQVGDDPRTTS